MVDKCFCVRYYENYIQNIFNLYAMINGKSCSRFGKVCYNYFGNNLKKMDFNCMIFNGVLI